MGEIFLANGSIRLDPHEVSSVEVEKITALFERALLRILLDDRIIITEYWRSRTAPRACSHKSQTPAQYATSVFLNNRPALPRVYNDGHRLNLSANVFHEMGDEFAIKAILHELAHVFFYAKCEPNHWVDGNADMKAKEIANISAECLVDFQIRLWGSDQTDLLKWRDRWEAAHLSTIQRLFPTSPSPRWGEGLLEQPLGVNSAMLKTAPAVVGLGTS